MVPEMFFLGHQDKIKTETIINYPQQVQCPVLTENSTLVGDRPVVNWTSGSGHLENDTYAGLSGKTKFTRGIVAKSDGTSSQTAWWDRASG